MADRDSETRHLLERLINFQIDDQQAQRGWTQGWDSFAAGATPGAGGASGTGTEAITFATGYDGTNTVTGFVFDFSTFDGADPLM